MTSLRSLALSACLLAPASLPAAQPAPEVPATSPRRGDIHRFVTLPGSVRAQQQVTLHAKVPGYVRAISVDRGDTVRAGQVLAELDLPEITAERGKLEAEARFAQAEADRIKAARAQAPDLITPQLADQAAARLASAQAALRGNDALLAYGRVTAPFAGTITQRHVDPGAFVPAATASAGPSSAAVVTLADYQVVRIHVAVPEVEAARVAPGQPVIVTTEALPGRTFNAKVSRHAGALDERTRSLAVEADIPNAEGTLRPGMYVSVRVGVELRRGALLVPAAALIREKAAAFLFTLVDGKASRIAVKAGFNDGTHAEILEGLAENARVLVPGKLTLTPGQAVTAVEAK